MNTIYSGRLAASYSAKDYAMEVSPDGTINVYRRGSAFQTVTADDNRLSEGVFDPRPGRLRERLAQLNRTHAEFWASRKGSTE